MALEEWDWPSEFGKIVEAMRTNLLLAEGAYRANDYGQCRAYLREVEALSWAARGEAQKRVGAKSP